MFFASWFPHGMTILSEIFLKKTLVSEIVANITCRATFLWTPLLLIFYDDRLRFSYYKSVKEKLRQKKRTDVNQKAIKVAESLIDEKKINLAENNSTLDEVICENQAIIREKIARDSQDHIKDKIIADLVVDKLGETIIVGENIAETQL